MLPTRTTRTLRDYLIFTALTCWLLPAQMTTTGSITGTVVDPSGHVIAGAKVTLISDRTSAARTSMAGEDGTFNMLAVQPDIYNMRIEQRGFKTHERRGLAIGANERVALGDVPLQIGEVTETVSVTAEAAQVQTDSSEHS